MKLINTLHCIDNRRLGSHILGSTDKNVCRILASLDVELRFVHALCKAETP